MLKVPTTNIEEIDRLLEEKNTHKILVHQLAMTALPTGLQENIEEENNELAKKKRELLQMNSIKTCCDRVNSYYY